MMSNRTNRRRSAGKRTTHQMVTQESIQTQILQRLLQIEKTQVEGFVERVPDVPRIIIARDKVYTFTRMTSLGTQMLNSTVSPIVFSNAPSLASVPFSAEFSTLFESWRIVQATWLFTPLFAGAVANPLYTWFDPDDDTLPTGTAEAAQSQTLRVSRSSAFVERSFSPRISLGGAANGTVTPGYVTPSARTWNDTASASTKYYGIKALIPANTNISNNVPLYAVECSLVLQFRMPM